MDSLYENSDARQSDAIRLAKKLLKFNPVYLDTETTGLNADDEIVEICVIDNDGSVLIDSLVKPTRKMKREVIELHGITNAMVRRAPFWPQIWPEIKKAISGRHVAIYNAVYDARMMRQSHRQNLMKWRSPDKTEFHCVMNLYARFYGEWDYKRDSWKWQKLGVAASQCGIVLNMNVHRAKADALMAREILQRMAKAK